MKRLTQRRLRAGGVFAVIAAIALVAFAGTAVAANVRDEISAEITEANTLRRAGKHVEAVRAAEAALVRARQTGDPELLERAVAVLGDCRFYNLDYAGAAVDFAEALKLSERLGNRRRQSEIHKSLGITWNAQGRSDLGLAHLHQAIEIADAHVPGGASRSTHANLGTVYQRLGARKLAIDEFRKALAPGAEPLTARGELDARTRIGSLYLDAGEPAAALPELRAALAAARDVSAVEEAWILGYLAAAEIAVGDTNAALATVQREAALHRLVEHGPALRLALVRIGDLQTANRQAARAAYETAAAIGSERGRTWSWLPPARLARLAAEEGDRERALAGYRAAADTLERFAGDLVDEEGLAVVADHRTIYEEWIAILLESQPRDAGELEEVITVSERARGALLEWSPGGAGRRGDDAGIVAQRKRDVADRLARMRAGSGDLAAGDPRRAEMERLELELWRLYREGVGRTRTPPARLLSAVQTQLAGSEAVLAYFGRGDEMILFVITSEHAEVLRLPLSDRELTLRVEALLGRLSAGAGEGWRAVAQRLYRDLIADALARLPNRIRTLTIVTDGSLTGLPFEVLLPPGEPSQPLISRYGFTYSESLSDLLTDRQGHSGTTGRLLVLHPGSAATLRSERDTLHALYREEGFTVAPLLHAENEVRAIRAAVGPGAHVLRGEQAREAALTRDALADFSAVHFTTHGMVSHWSPWRSALLLAAGEEDGLLQAREIAARFPPCQLVVLAACRTAVGQPQAGRAVRSLAEAFRHAGARTVIASLWDVDDASTARLFKAFYGALADGTPPAEALRRAKLSLLKNRATASPRHWAGFLVYGNGITAVELAPVDTAPAGPQELPRTITMIILAACSMLVVLFASRR